MRRFNTELCHNIRWVFFYFVFVAVCFIQSDLRVDKTISVRLYGAFNSYQKNRWFVPNCCKNQTPHKHWFFEVFLYQKWLKPKCNRNLFLMRGLHLIER